MTEIYFDLNGLDDKWTRQSHDHPACAACGLRIGGDVQGGAGDGTGDEPEVPVRFFRGEGDAMVELALHWKCAQKRMCRGGPERN